MSFKDWLKFGWLVEHKSSRKEIEGLLGVADRDLADCQVQGLSPDGCLNIAYHSALQTATAALAASGFRPTKESHHYRVIQSLEFTIGAEKKLINRFDKFRKKRNIGEYEQAGIISNHEAEEIVAFAKDLRQTVEYWLRNSHPELMS